MHDGTSRRSYLKGERGGIDILGIGECASATAIRHLGWHKWVHGCIKYHVVGRNAAQLEGVSEFGLSNNVRRLAAMTQSPRSKS